MKPLKIAVVAGEASGDLLGGDLVAALKKRLNGNLKLVGVGGPSLMAEGLASFFDYSEIAIMGFVAVIKKLPRLLSLIKSTADAIIDEKPDLLLIIDSPDFTHRVAKRVRKALPDLPIIDYVCPSVWAWKEYRAKAMLDYVDHVLAVLPFEPAVMARLGGPETTYIGHRLRSLDTLLRARESNFGRWHADIPEQKTLLLLPGSRSHEVKRLLPLFAETVRDLKARIPNFKILLATVPHQEHNVRAIIADWPEKPELFVGEESKWQAFSQADAALAASGTVLLELALAGIPAISTYKTDVLIRLILSRIKVWSAALPNLIADYPVVPEYFDEFIRPAMLARWMDELLKRSPTRDAMLCGYDVVFNRMGTERTPSEEGADIILKLLGSKKPGHF